MISSLLLIAAAAFLLLVVIRVGIRIYFREKKIHLVELLEPKDEDHHQ